MSAILLALRSNGAWFAGPQTREQLIQRLKNCLVLYDDIGIQEGTYQATVGGKNTTDWFFPPGMGRDRSRVVYFEEGTEFGLNFRPSGSTEPMSRLFQDTIQYSYRADFYPILEEAGLLEVPFVRRLDIELDGTPRALAEQAARQALREEGLRAALPGNDRLKGIIVKGLFIDATLALAAGVPLMVDHHCSAVVEFQIGTGGNRWASDGRGHVHSALVDLGLPDFGGESWDDVIRVRESAAGGDLRSMISRVAQQVIDASQSGASRDDLGQLAQRGVSRELVNEVTNRQPSIKSLVLKIGLNLIPYGLSSVTDFVELVRSKRSWISLLRGSDLDE